MYYVYMVECSDETLYTGYTNDISQRVSKHNEWKWAKYTKARRPVKLVFSEEYETKSGAMKREYEIKQLSRDQKRELI